ncbi:MAG: outer membrane protein assembly factor BamA [Bacteroidia bacterium]
MRTLGFLASRAACLVLCLLWGSINLEAQAPNQGIGLSASDIVRSYTIAQVRVEGLRHTDQDLLMMIAGLRQGQRFTLMGEEGAKAVRNLWKQGLFGDVQIRVDSVVDDRIFLCLVLEEKPRLSKVVFNRKVSKAKAEEMTESLKTFKGKILTDEVKGNIRRVVRKYYTDKGYLEVQVSMKAVPDTNQINASTLMVTVEPGVKVRVEQLDLSGNSALDHRDLSGILKTARPRVRWNPFRNGKWDPEKFEEQKAKLVRRYQRMGYRDARILKDSVYSMGNGQMGIKVELYEGRPYYIRRLEIEGNSVHSDSLLLGLLGVKVGDLYNKELIESKLQMDPSGRDISSLYMDDGYLFFQVSSHENRVEGDSVDLIVRVVEGAQATVRRVTVKGNDKTSDHVIIRELRTRPGQKFSRSDVMRTTRELSQLGYFDPEQLGVVPTPNPQDGTVDIEYKVTERSNDQVELSGGWGAGQVVGSLGLVLNNFSTRKMFNPKAWTPVPGGDGQRVSIRAQSNGRFFSSYNLSFTEPWLGGKKPNSFTVSGYVSIQVPNGLPRTNPLRQSITIKGTSVSFGQRLKKPDDFFTAVHSLNFQQFVLVNNQNTAFLPDGVSNNFFIKETLSRNSVDQPIFPRSGTNLSLVAQIAPPYSLLGRTIKPNATAQERYKWVEYHKWRFDFQQYTKLVGNLVLMSRVQYGWLGNYSSITGEVPFGRFYVGGDGIMGFALDDRELIGLRGYQNNSLTPRDAQTSQLLGATAFQKYTMEFRYPLSLNPSATIYATTFLEAGNSFRKAREFDPFLNYRSAGVGVRVFLPMFGLLGVDWGYGFDPVPGAGEVHKGNVHISIGQSF